MSWMPRKKHATNACRLQQAEQVALCLVHSGQYGNSIEQQVLVGTYLLSTGLSAAASIALLHHCCYAALVLSIYSKQKKSTAAAVEINLCRQTATMSGVRRYVK